MTIKTLAILLGEHPCIMNIFLGPVTVHYREVLLYIAFEDNLPKHFCTFSPKHGLPECLTNILLMNVHTKTYLDVYTILGPLHKLTSFHSILSPVVFVVKEFHQIFSLACCMKLSSCWALALPPKIQ